MNLIENVLDPLLFCDIRAFHDWESQAINEDEDESNIENLDNIPEGEYLDFFRLIPTYSDRKSLYLAVMDIEMKHTNESLVM